MEFISFIKGLQKKGKIYQDVWMSILFRLEEKDTIELNRRLDLSKSQYYRIISFGMKLWNEKIPQTPIELNYGKLSILKTETIKQVKPKAEKKAKNEPKIIEAEINMEEVYESIIYYLNQKAGTGYKSQTTSYRSFINARLKAGYKIEDFYKVIDNKSSEWIGTDFQKFLRPETLFGNKFESYLNQISKKTKQEIAYEQVSEATRIGWNTNNKPTAN